MAVYAATDHKITVNGTNLSNVLQSATLDLSSDELETTAFGGGWRRTGQGLLAQVSSDWVRLVISLS